MSRRHRLKPSTQPCPFEQRALSAGLGSSDPMTVPSLPAFSTTHPPARQYQRRLHCHSRPPSTFPSSTGACFNRETASIEQQCPCQSRRKVSLESKLCFVWCNLLSINPAAPIIPECNLARTAAAGGGKVQQDHAILPPSPGSEHIIMQPTPKDLLSRRAP